jgi:hypothetical protein
VRRHSSAHRRSIDCLRAKRENYAVAESPIVADVSSIGTVVVLAGNPLTIANIVHINLPALVGTELTIAGVQVHECSDAAAGKAGETEGLQQFVVEFALSKNLIRRVQGLRSNKPQMRY